MPNLMIGFGIDQIQAEFVADIRLRNINKEYILKRTQEVDSLEEEIADLQDLVNSPRRIRQVIIGELEQVKKKYALPRRTDIVYDHQTEELLTAEEEVPDYPVNLFLSREGYLKKITPQSLRMSGEQKYKDGDGPFLTWEPPTGTSCWSLPTGSSAIRPGSANLRTPSQRAGGLPATKLAMDQEERVVWACIPGDYRRQLLFFFDNGKAARWNCPPTRPRPAGKSSPGPIPTRPPWSRPSWSGRTLRPQCTPPRAAV